LQAQLQTLPWVANVAVERSWPDTLIIRVKEYEPVALWGTHNLLAKEGEIFSPGTATVDMNKLPMLSGPDADAKSVLETYQKMQKMLRPLHLQIKELKVTNRHAWQLKLNNGMVLNLGGKQVLERLHEFAQVYPTVFANSPNKTANIDLRYDHGMAVQWQTKSETEG
jgi:cell division protein FtsQ